MSNAELFLAFWTEIVRQGYTPEAATDKATVAYEQLKKATGNV